ncbi:MAG: redoxin domain-containing protein [Pseudomonadales bacterium]|nr:redoxin domain-containing protein [Pseudomonadales bacterium]
MLHTMSSDIRSLDVRIWMLVLLLILPYPGFSAGRGDIAPNFSLPLIANPPNGTKTADKNAQPLFQLLDLADYKGRIVYIDFWQTNCAPCRESLPMLSRMRDEFDRKDVEILAISTDPDPRDALTFIEQHNISLPVLSDPGAIVAGQYGLSALPAAYIVDRAGYINSVKHGYTTGHTEIVRNKLRDLSNSDHLLEKQ